MSEDKMQVQAAGPEAESRALWQQTMQALNLEQRAVVGELERNLLLLAPAGTGKTNTLACRIAAILQAGCAEPEEILCLTFTNKACREMRQRIEQLAGEAGGRVIVRTLHGFCYDLIKAEAKRHSDLFADFTIFDEVDGKSLLKELGEQLLTDAWPLQSVQNLIEQLKSARALQSLQRKDAADYETVLQRLVAEQAEAVRQKCLDENWHFYPKLYEGWQQWGPGFTTAYDTRLQELHGLDFTDLIVQTGLLLQQDAIAGRWARRFLYINIDEVQDTSELEYRVVERLFGSSHLLLCGDYFQTIYEWRGSHPEVVLKAYQDTYKPQRIVLHENYRSTQVLLQASFACLSAMFPERVAAIYPEGIQAMSRTTGAPIQLKTAQDAAEEAWWIYQTIQQLPVTDYSRVCILTRSNRYNKLLSGWLEEYCRGVPPAQRLPFMLIDELKFFRRQEIKDALAFLRLTLNKHDVTSLVRILTRFGTGIGQTAIRRISSAAYRRAGLRITDYLDPLARAAGDPFAPLMEALAAGNVVVFDVEATGVDPTRDEIIQIAGIRINAKGEVVARFEQLLQPTRQVGDSVRVHKLTDDFLAAHGQDPAVVLRAFCDFARGSIIVGHNVTYDLSILGSQLARLGLSPLDYPAYFDTLDIFRRFYPSLPNHRLEYLGQYCQVKHASSHDAMDDILATAEILQYALQRNIIPYTGERRQYFAAYAAPFAPLAELLVSLRQDVDRLRPCQILARIVNEGGIVAYYEQKKEEQRVENLRDLYRQARERDTDKSVRPRDAALNFLRESTLSATDLEAQTQKAKIPLITVHQAKGTEFDYIFLAGLQEGTFPVFSARDAGRLDEEKRLFYVAITRAKKRLFLSWSQTGPRGYFCHPSPFLAYLPAQDVQQV